MKITRFINLFICMHLSFIVHAQHPEFAGWTDTTQLPFISGKPNPGLAGPVTGIHNNILLIAGGANFPEGLPWEGGKKIYQSAIYRFDLSSGKPEYLSAVDHLSKPLAYSASCNTPQGIVTVGGENSDGISNAVYLFSIHPINHSLTIKSLPSLPVPTSNAVAVAVQNTIYIIGGETTIGTTAACWKMELDNPDQGWQSIAALPVPLAYTNGVLSGLPGNQALIVLGGRRKNSTGISVISDAVYAYSLETKKWMQQPSLPYPVSAGTAIAAGDSGVFLFGGDKAETFTQVEQTIAAIAFADENQKPALISKKNNLLSAHPGFSRDILLYDTKTGKSVVVGQIPYPAPVTTTALMHHEKLILPTGEIRAGVRTPAVLTATLKIH